VFSVASLFLRFPLLLARSRAGRTRAQRPLTDSSKEIPVHPHVRQRTIGSVLHQGSDFEVAGQDGVVRIVGLEDSNPATSYTPTTMLELTIVNDAGIGRQNNSS
jgi:hypothetical protein